ncbi:MAG: HAMP domain-containing sensor histidine kinase [bacterium]
MTRVLVIDDEDSIRESLTIMLRLNGYNTISATNGAEGMELARRERPDLIISDIRMEFVDGFQLLSYIRNQPETSSIPFILITGEPDHAKMRYGMELGADDYLVKPFTQVELIGAIRARLEKHQKLITEAEVKLVELRAQLSTALPHELTTPLNGILGYADILRKQFAELEPIEVHQMAERIYKNGRRLQRLVENFLLYAQLEILKSDSQKTDALKKNRTPDAAKLLDMAARHSAYEAERTNDLTLELQTAEVTISADYFKKIFEELFDNALRYSKKGTPISVQASPNGKFYRLRIEDNGRGMTSEHVRLIGAYMQFDRKFYEQQGSGLGLIVARRLTEVHGGTLHIESEYGKGTTLIVLLPLAQVEI